MKQLPAILTFSFVCCAWAQVPAQPPDQPTSPPRGSTEWIKVHGKSLEGNLEGDSPGRDVSIYLPPSYQTSKRSRYPVVYLLHGYTDSGEKWFGLVKHFIGVPEVAGRALADVCPL
jgi:hypothetical protein